MAKNKKTNLEEEIVSEFKKLAEEYKDNAKVSYAEALGSIRNLKEYYGNLSKDENLHSKKRYKYLSTLTDILIRNLHEWDGRPYFYFTSVLSDFNLKSEDMTEKDTRAVVNEPIIKEKIRAILNELQWTKSIGEKKFLYRGSVAYVKTANEQYGFLYCRAPEPI